MSDRAQNLFVSTPEFKEAIAQYAHNNNMTASEVIRIAVAQYIGYDIELATMGVGARKKYASKEERQAEYNRKNKEARQSVKKLVEEYLSDQHKQNVNSLEEWLARRAVRNQE